MAKILFAEDEAEFGLTMTRYLGMQGYAVEYTADGLDALHFLTTFGFDAAILDWELPGISGVEICKQLRRNGNKLPILMLTGRNTTKDTVSGIDAGADDYLTKPIDPAIVVAKLKALLRRAASLTDKFLRMGDLKLDPEAYTVYLNENQVHLLPKEFALLEFFMRNMDRVFTVDEVISHVWGTNETVTGESVRSCVSRLRKKLTSPDRPELIENIYGAGYILRSNSST